MKNKFLLGALPLISVMFFTSCQKEPTANISASKTTVELNEDVKFTNTSVNGDNYKWEFGDGQSSTDKEPSHKWSVAGTYTVKMTAFSKNGKKDNDATVSITVNDINKKFLGSYNMNGSCNGAYTMAVTAIGSTGIMLNNFINNGEGWNLNATVYGSTFTVPLQTFSTANGDYGVTGNGSLSGNTLTMSLNINYTDYFDPAFNTSDNCVDTGSK